MPLPMSAGDMTRIRRLERVTKVVPLSNPFSYFSALPNTNPTSTFVLACIDPRFAYALEQYLDQTYAQNGSSYDLFILAGASMGGNLTGNGAPLPNCSIVTATTSWRQTLRDHIQVAITLHNVTQVVIIDHLNCGAYVACASALVGPPADQDRTLHTTQFDNLKSYINGLNFFANTTGTSTSGSTIFTSINGYYFDGVEASPTTNLRFISDPLSGTPILSEPKGTNSGAKVLVLGCIDPRYSAVMTSFLNNYQGVQFIYDLFILAGASLGANQSYTATFPTPRTDGNRGDYPNNILANGTAGIGDLGRTWGPTFFDHLRVARLLHTITEVWVFDHLDCGAYKAILFGDLGVSDDLIGPHITEIAKLQSLINQFTPVDGLNSPYTLSFKGFVIDKAGTIRNVIDDNTGTKIDNTIEFGTSRIRNPASSFTDTLAFRRADYITQAQPLDMTQNQTRVGLSQQNLTTLCPCVTVPHVPRVICSALHERLRLL